MLPIQAGSLRDPVSSIEVIRMHACVARVFLHDELKQVANVRHNDDDRYGFLCKIKNSGG